MQSLMPSPTTHKADWSKLIKTKEKSFIINQQIAGINIKHSPRKTESYSGTLLSEKNSIFISQHALIYFVAKYDANRVMACAKPTKLSHQTGMETLNVLDVNPG